VYNRARSLTNEEAGLEDITDASTQTLNLAQFVDQAERQSLLSNASLNAILQSVPADVKQQVQAQPIVVDCSSKSGLTSCGRRGLWAPDATMKIIASTRMITIAAMIAPATATKGFWLSRSFRYLRCEGNPCVDMRARPPLIEIRTYTAGLKRSARWRSENIVYRRVM
jgi:hypothetical protein